jgi:hypothetical protein
MTAQLWERQERLTPWVLFDLERIAWVLEQRRGELTPEELDVLRTVTARLAQAADAPR